MLRGSQVLRVSQLRKMVVFQPKKKAEGELEELERKSMSKLGKIHQTVFSPDGTHVVGFMVRRPDIAGMVKRPDVFLALDSFAVNDLGLVISRPDGTDDKARERLHLEWDKCLIWEGMDAKTEDGHELGWIGDVEFDAKTGLVSIFFVGDGSISESLVGNVEIPLKMLRGYSKGYMIVADEAAHLQLDGGLAAKAGEGYAKAKIQGKAAGEKIGAAAGTAVEKGAYGLGKLIGKAQRAVKEATADDEPEVEAPTEPQEIEGVVTAVESDEGGLLDGETSEPRTFVPVSEIAPEDAADSRQVPPAADAAKLKSKPTADAVESESKAEAGPEPAAAEPKAEKGAAKPAAKPKSDAKTQAKAKPKKKEGIDTDKIARDIGKQLGKTHGMFSAFVDEYKKASK